jgi:hypothetical protein
MDNETMMIFRPCVIENSLNSLIISAMMAKWMRVRHLHDDPDFQNFGRN